MKKIVYAVVVTLVSVVQMLVNARHVAILMAPYMKPATMGVKLLVAGSMTVCGMVALLIWLTVLGVSKIIYDVLVEYYDEKRRMEKMETKTEEVEVA